MGTYRESVNIKKYDPRKLDRLYRQLYRKIYGHSVLSKLRAVRREKYQRKARGRIDRYTGPRYFRVKEPGPKYKRTRETEISAPRPTKPLKYTAEKAPQTEPDLKQTVQPTKSELEADGGKLAKEIETIEQAAEKDQGMSLFGPFEITEEEYRRLVEELKRRGAVAGEQLEKEEATETRDEDEETPEPLEEQVESESEDAERNEEPVEPEESDREVDVSLEGGFHISPTLGIAFPFDRDEELERIAEEAEEQAEQRETETWNEVELTQAEEIEDSGISTDESLVEPAPNIEPESTEGKAEFGIESLEDIEAREIEVSSPESELIPDEITEMIEEELEKETELLLKESELYSVEKEAVEKESPTAV